MENDQRLNWITLATSFLLSSCATMTPDQCKHANWHEIGQSDGRAGEPISMFENRRNDCAEAHVGVDSRAYLAGRDIGLRTYCRLEHAVQVGLDGQAYHGVCPAPIDGEFRRRFQIGAAVHELRNEVSNLEGRIESMERRQHTIDHDEEKALKDAHKEDEHRRIRHEFDSKRNEIRDEVRNLDKKLHYSRERLREAEYALGTLR